MMARTVQFAALLIAIASMASSTAFARPITADDIARISQVSDPQVAPGGRWVAYTVTTTNVTADAHISHLWITSWDGARTLQLVRRKHESETKARFSPDGRWLAYIANIDGESFASLWLKDRTSGQFVRLPGIEGSVTDIAWSPNAKMLALVVDDPDPRTTHTHPTPIVIDRFQFKREGPGYRGSARSRIWIYDLAARRARRLTTGDYDEGLPAWSPDSRAIAFTSNHAPDPDRSYDSNLYVAEVAKAPVTPRALTSFAGADNDITWSSYPAWSPDGRRIAYLRGGPVRLFAYGVHTLAVVPAKGGAPKVLTPALDRNVHDPVWSHDGKSIRFIVEDDESGRIAEVASDGGPVRPVIGGYRVFSAPSAAPLGAMAVLLTTPDAPNEVYALGADGTLRQLSHQNDRWLKQVSIAPVKRTVLHSMDGTEVHGFLVTPPGTALHHLPTVLLNHGGPQWRFDAGFNIDWQIFAGHGYAVVATNPRGSIGRGQAYSAAVYADWGGPDVPDALAAVDDAVARGIADPKRLFVGGWSYGGMLTNYLTASDKRFRAAVSGAAIMDMPAGYGTDVYIRDWEMEYGTPWKNLKGWLKVSYPFFHNDRITTPTLFMGGDHDNNVPLFNSEQMYQALKSRKIGTELVIYPGEPHDLTRPSFLKDKMQRWLAWYDNHGGAPGSVH